jgi:hypothetical protein
MAWFNAVALAAEEGSPCRLQKMFQPEQVRRVDGERPTSSGSWDKYRAGDRLPKSGFDPDGNPYLAELVGERFPDTLDVLEHPLWDAIQEKPVGIEQILETVDRLPPMHAYYYHDLNVLEPESPVKGILESPGQSIWVDDGHWQMAIEHLAIQLMLLRLDMVRLNATVLPKMAEKLGTLIHITAQAGWISDFHEEFYDWLEANIWRDLFDRHHVDSAKVTGVVGWRRTIPRRVTSV